MKKFIIGSIILSLCIPIFSANALRKRRKHTPPCPDAVAQGAEVEQRCQGTTIVCPSIIVEGADVSARCTGASGLTQVCPLHSDTPPAGCEHISQPISAETETEAVPYKVVGIECLEGEECELIEEGDFAGYYLKSNLPLDDPRIDDIRDNMFTLAALNKERELCEVAARVQQRCKELGGEWNAEDNSCQLPNYAAECEGFGGEWKQKRNLWMHSYRK